MRLVPCVVEHGGDGGGGRVSVPQREFVNSNRSLLFPSACQFPNGQTVHFSCLVCVTLRVCMVEFSPDKRSHSQQLSALFDTNHSFSPRSIRNPLRPQIDVQDYGCAQRLLLGDNMPFRPCVLVDLCIDPGFDQGLYITSFRHSWPMGRKVHEALANVGNQYTVLG